jgi:hypothetical protein
VSEPRSPNPPPLTLDLPLAAFGTLSNGSDVRLLASPEGLRLPPEAESRLESFFYAAWKSVGVRRTPYYAFIPLSENQDGEQSLWGLLQVSPLGRGAVGEVLVVWAALFTVAQLDSIGWATHRLLSSAFPQPAALPAPNTRLPPRRVELITGESAVVDAYNSAFDRVAYAIAPDPTHVGGWRAEVQVVAPAAEGLTPLSVEGALFGLWNRLGRWRADVSYCTWAGITGFATRGAEDIAQINLLLSDDGATAAPGPFKRIVLSLGADTAGAGLAPPPPAWVGARLLDVAPALHEDDLAVPGDAQAVTAAATTLAGYLFADVRDGLIEQDSAGLLERITAGFLHVPMFGAALPQILRLSVEAFGANRRDAGRFVDHYVSATLRPMLIRYPEQRADLATARLALNHGLLSYLEGETLESLSGALFGDGQEPGLEREIVQALDLDTTGDGDWSPLLSLLRTRAQAGGPALDLCLRVIAHAWPQPAGGEAAHEVLVALSAKPGFRAVLPIAGMASRPDVRRDLFQALNRLRPSARRRRTLAGELDRFRLLAAGEQIHRGVAG